MVDEDLVKRAELKAAFYQVFTNPKRVLILWVLAKREKTVSEIAAEVGATLQNTSQHLRLLKERGILNSRRDGQLIYYSIVNSKVLERLDFS